MYQTARFIGFMAILALATASAACRGSSSGDDDGDDDGVPDAAGGGTSIYDVQSETMPVGTPVVLEGVVVTAIDPNGPGVYVQEPAGGPFSGILVYRPSNFAEIAVGDVVSVSGGLKDEFMYTPSMGTPDDKSMTELAPGDGGQITMIKTGTATIVPQVVDAIALAASEDEAEKWESVLIKLENVAVVQAPRAAGSATEMRVTGPFRVQDRLTPLAAGGTEFALNDCFVSITGIVNYFYDYKLLPRSEADYVTGGTGCPAQEADVETCSDMIDNDHDGFTDCADFSCQEAAGVDCTNDTTVVDIQNGTLAEGALVALDDVVVTAVYVDPTPNMGGFFDHTVWVQDGATAQFNGVAVHRPIFATGTINDVAVGDVVDIEGEIAEFSRDTDTSGRSVTQLVSATITDTGTTAAAPSPLAVTVAVLADPVTAEPYEGVLVELNNVKVVDAALMFGEWTVGTAAASIAVDDLMTPRPTGLAAGDCYAKIVGALHYDNGHFSIQPRPGDLVTGAACP